MTEPGAARPRGDEFALNRIIASEPGAARTAREEYEKCFRTFQGAIKVIDRRSEIVVWKADAALAEADQTIAELKEEISTLKSIEKYLNMSGIEKAVAEKVQAEADTEYHKGQAKLWNTALQDALERAEQAEAETRKWKADFSAMEMLAKDHEADWSYAEERAVKYKAEVEKLKFVIGTMDAIDCYSYEAEKMWAERGGEK